jgi:hypothetical protein
VVLRLFSGSGHNTDTLHTVTIALMLATLVEGSAMLVCAHIMMVQLALSRRMVWTRYIVYGAYGAMFR